MATLYSVCIADVHGTDTGTVLEVPLDPTYVWVIRDMSFFAPGATAASFQAYDDQDVTWYQEQAVPADFGAWAQWTGRQVFDSEAPALFLAASAITIAPPTFDVRVSGYRLTRP